MSVRFILFLLIVAVVLYFMYQYNTAKTRCEEVGQELTWNTFWNIPELYEMVTSPNRGTPSERYLVSKLLSAGFKPTAIYHDLMVKTSKGKTSQIDIVLATDVGLIIIEVKDFAGWIFGKGNQDNWTQVSGYGRYRNRFYNPFKQNEGHIKALRGLSSEMQTLPMYSLVVFAGNCELKDVTFIPHDCYLATLYRVVDAVYDIIYTHPPVKYKNRWEVANLLKNAVDCGGNVNLKEQHVYDIHDMLGTNRKYE